jgi:SAM-dependent methyltransferase
MTETKFLDRNCPVCGSVHSTNEVHSDRRAEELEFEALRPFWSGFFKEKVFFSYHRCRDCGLLFARNFFTDAQLDSLYAQMAPNMDLVTTDAILATQRGYYDVAAKAGAQAGGYLEIGPDVGYIVEHAARSGNYDQFWLFEPNLSVHEKLAGATLGLPHEISTSMTDLSAVPDGSVGLAVMIHVLDHLLDPVAMLEQIRRKLRPDGALVTVTHNEKSALRHIMGLRWPPFCLQHPEVYNPASITELMQRSGFGTVRVERSKNYFPFDFMVKQAAWTAKIDLSKASLPKTRIGLKLGNIMTIARAG